MGKALDNRRGLFKACLELCNQGDAKLCPPAYALNGFWWLSKGECLKYMNHIFVYFMMHHGGFWVFDLCCQITNLVSQRLTTARLDQHGRHVAKVVCKDGRYVGMSNQLLVVQVKMSRIHGCQFCRVRRQIVIQGSILPGRVGKGQIYPRLYNEFSACAYVAPAQTYWYQYGSLWLR